MALIYRQTKGSPLTFQELDGNFQYITGSINVISRSYATTGSNTFNGNQIIYGSITGTTGLTIAGNIVSNSGSVTINGNLSVLGTASLSMLIYNQSIVTTGSTIFGSSMLDTHRFTGSLYVTGSIYMSGGTINSDLTGTSSYATNALTASYALNGGSGGGSIDTSSFVVNSQTSSFVQNSQTSSFATVGSNTFTGNQVLFDGNLTITGSNPLAGMGLILGDTASVNPPINSGPSEFLIKLGHVGSNYYIFAYMDGQWRSASLS